MHPIQDLFLGRFFICTTMWYAFYTHSYVDKILFLWKVGVTWTQQMGDWETKCPVSWFDCDESLTCRDLNLNPRHFGGSTKFIFVLCGQLYLLILWCAGGRCGMVDSDEDHGRSRRPGAEDQGWSSIGQVLSDQTVERSTDAMCGLYHAWGDKERGFLNLASKPRSTVSSGLASKPVASGFPVWAS
jgi:hypothetical protein